MSGAWRNEAGDVCFSGGVKAGAYDAVDAPLAKKAGRVGKAEGHPFNPKGPTVGDWAAASGVEGLEAQMWNKVRKCGQCGKPNAFTLTACNSCGAALPEAYSHTPNLFCCIVYGFDAVGLSLRHQEDDVLVIDDLLSLSACHLNSIWAGQHIPSVVQLFAMPPDKALAVVRKMGDACAHAFRTQFVAHPTFMKKYVKNVEAVKDPLSLVAMGFNTPPSQYQLHLQYIMLPLLPFQHAQQLLGNHFTEGRFLPFRYVTAALEALVKEPDALGFAVDGDTTIDRIIERVHGAFAIDYSLIWKEETTRYVALQEAHGNWDAANFETTVNVATAQGQEVQEIANADKLVLQSYGRPYNQEGKPDASNHYSLAKAPGELKAVL